MKKIFVSILAAALLCGCDSSNKAASTAITSTKSVAIASDTDISSMNSSVATDGTSFQALGLCMAGLVQLDSNGIAQPDLAESWEHNEDSTVWTFHLRDAKWVTNTEEEYADVTAEDFVNGVRHLSDFQGATIAIAESYVKGLAEYGKSERTDADWDKVGIKALDDKTVEYTLTAPTPFFHTVVANNSFWPVNKEFLESKGDGCKLGSPDPTNCSYGKATDPSSILYNGAYILDEIVSKSSQKMHKNEQYWDAEHVYIQNVNRVFDDGSDPASTVKGFESESNPYYQAVLLTTAKDFESYLEQYKEYAFNPQQNGYTFGINFNFNRTNFDNSSKTKAQQADAKKALLNTHFRKALKYGFDRVSYMATVVDKTIAEKEIRTLETPWNFVSTSDGKSYGELVQAASEDPSIDLSEGQDSIYNPEKAKEELELAKKELTDVSWPIVLDLLTDDASASLPKQAASLEQSIEGSLGSENVDIVVHPVSDDEYTASSYTATGPWDACWDISTSTGWGADYIDPKTYLSIFSPVNGDVLSQVMGLCFYGSNEYDNDADNKANDAAIEAVGLLDYQKMIDDAYAINDDLDARYEAEAKAEAYLLDNAIAIPVQTQTKAVNFTLSRAVPFSGAYQSSKYKGLIIQKDPVKAEDYNAAYEQWKKDKVADAKKNAQ